MGCNPRTPEGRPRCQLPNAKHVILETPFVNPMAIQSMPPTASAHCAHHGPHASHCLLAGVSGPDAHFPGPLSSRDFSLSSDLSHPATLPITIPRSCHCQLLSTLSNPFLFSQLWVFSNQHLKMCLLREIYVVAFITISVLLIVLMSPQLLVLRFHGKPLLYSYICLYRLAGLSIL